MKIPQCVREQLGVLFTLLSVYALKVQDDCRYNKLNGLHVSEDPFMLKDVLRKEWGSDATTMSDW